MVLTIIIQKDAGHYNQCCGSGIIVPVPDPAKNECADKNLIFNFLNNL